MIQEEVDSEEVGHDLVLFSSRGLCLVPHVPEEMVQDSVLMFKKRAFFGKKWIRGEGQWGSTLSN